MTFPFRHTCHYDDCSQTTRGFEGYCREYCGQVYCVEHRKPPFHNCRDYWLDPEKRAEGQDLVRAREIREWIRLHTSLDKTRITIQASALRPGHNCSIDMPDAEEVKSWNEKQCAKNWRKYVKKGLSGGYGTANQHYLVTFDDGVKDILRVVMDSEIATMQLLSEKEMKVPRAYRPPALPQTDGDIVTHPNDLYFFTEHVSGKPFPVGSLAIQTKIVDRLIAEGRLTGSILDTFARALAHQMIRLSEIKFTSSGSLYPSGDAGQAVIGPAINSIVGIPDPPYFHGPFKTAREKWLTSIDHQLDLILNHGQHGKDGPFCYLTYLDLKDIIEQCDELKRENSEFYIHNIDAKGQQFMVREDGDISSWLDWEWTTLTTKEEAFAAPDVFGGRDLQLNLTSWELRLIDIYEELGRADLAVCVKGGTKYHWLTILCHTSSGLMPHIQHHQQFRYLILGDVDPMLLRGEVVKAWADGLKRKHKDDEGYQQLLAREQARRTVSG